MPLLFSRIRVFDVLEYQQRELKAAVNGLSAQEVEQTSTEELVHRIAANYKLEVPVLEEEKVHASNREIDVDVSRDPMRIILDRSRPFYLKGTELTISVPFRGNPQLFDVQPTTFTLNPPTWNRSR